MTLLFIEPNATGAEAERKDFRRHFDQMENADTPTTLKQTAIMILASVVLRNGLGNNTKLRRLISRPGGASNISPETTSQKSPLDEHASSDKEPERRRAATDDTEPA